MLKELLLIFLVCLVASSIFAVSPPQAAREPSADAALNSPEEEFSNSTTEAASAGAAETTDETFDEDVLASNQPVLVDFSTSGCMPCKRMAPIIDDLSREYEGRLKIMKVDADLNPKIVQRYKVIAYPTFILFNQGKPVVRSSGAMPKNSLVTILDHYAANSPAQVDDVAP